MIWPKNKLTRFEVARIVGARSLQIALGAPILVEYKENKFDPIEIAEEEFKANKMPMTIKRTLPNNQIIIVDIKSAINNWLEEHQRNS